MMRPPARAKLLGSRLGHADESGLGGGVVDLPGVAGDTGDRADIDDAACFGAQHHGAAQAEHIERALEIGRNDLVELCFAHAYEQTVPGNARIVDQNAGHAHRFLDLLERGITRGEIGNVPCLCDRLHTIRAALFRDCFGLLD